MASEGKWHLNTIKFICFLIICMMVGTGILTLSAILRDLPCDSLMNLAKAKRPNARVNSEDYGSHQPVTVKKDKLLGGLLPSGFDEASCLSRHESVFYLKGLNYKPSSYLISRLRDYEALHRKCGPHTELYNRSIELIKSGQYNGSADCRYLVWISFSGLGNRMLTIASAFLYALLTNRVLLIDPGVDTAGLFCEPFPDVSWWLPPDFPLINQFSEFVQNSPHSYGYMVKKNIIGNSSIQSPFIYLHLAYDYDDQDKLFFCDLDQSFLQKIPWQVMKTDNYFVPFLFLIPSFEQELSNLFPEKESVFHFLGRYLFHPANSVWGLVKTYYQAYLAQADEKIGIQIRVWPGEIHKYEPDKIIDCIMKENLLPKINESSEPIILSQSGKQRKTIAVLITSLSPKFSEVFQKMYWENPTVTGDIVSIYQPSQEEHQQKFNLVHEKKALAEVYLLSLSDKLVISGRSTFGYVAQSLGGLKPWILYKPNYKNIVTNNQSCVRTASLEPCFHSPPNYGCKDRTTTETSKIVPHVRHCEDESYGLKLFDQNSEL